MLSGARKGAQMLNGITNHAYTIVIVLHGARMKLGIPDFGITVPVALIAVTPLNMRFSAVLEFG